MEASSKLNLKKIKPKVEVVEKTEINGGKHYFLNPCDPLLWPPYSPSKILVYIDLKKLEESSRNTSAKDVIPHQELLIEAGDIRPTTQLEAQSEYQLAEDNLDPEDDKESYIHISQMKVEGKLDFQES